jgi:O-antigen/teichoic acid export membrane protein
MRKQAIWATVWSGADALLRQGITFIISIVLARLLAPEEFGTYALLSLLVGISSVLAR